MLVQTSIFPFSKTDLGGLKTASTIISQFTVIQFGKPRREKEAVLVLAEENPEAQ